MQKNNIVIYLSSQPHNGGKYQYSVSILEALSLLSKEKFHLTAIYANNDWKPLLEKLNVDRTALRVSISWLSAKVKSLLVRRLNFIWLWRFLSKYIDSLYQQIAMNSPDMVFYPGNDSLAYEYDLPSAIPIFDLMHRYENFPEVSSPEIYKSREKHYKNICKYAKVILVDSELGKRHVLECYTVDQNKIKVLPYIPPSYVYKDVDISILEKYNLPDEFIFYPAQFWAHKNHLGLLSAIHVLKEKHGLLVNAVFVGAPKNKYDEVVNKIDELRLDDQIKILGYVSNEELVALYKKAKALVMPSFFGPTNIPPLEALAVGCPVLISDIYAHKEQLGDSVLYFNPNQVKDICNVIKDIWTENESLLSNLATTERKKISLLTPLNSSRKIDHVLSMILEDSLEK